MLAKPVLNFVQTSYASISGLSLIVRGSFLPSLLGLALPVLRLSYGGNGTGFACLSKAQYTALLWLNIVQYTRSQKRTTPGQLGF